MVANFGRNLLGALAREPGEPAPIPQAARDKARRLLDQYQAYTEDPYHPREWDPDALRPSRWMAEAAGLLEQIAGER